MKIGSRTFNFGSMPAIMAIMNTTPDSFYSGSRLSATEDAIEQALKLESSGADIIDIGGESTRPGSLPVSIEEELKRVIPVVEMVCKKVRIPVSIDTNKGEVAERGINAGAALVNDVSALTADKSMADIVKNYSVPVVLMHMKGTPDNMQNAPSYHDPVAEITTWLLGRAAFAEKKGIAAEKIILDPGIGFGKRLEDNLKLIRGFSAAVNGRYPVLIGHSRKRFIGEITGQDKPENRLYGSLGAAVMSAYYGAAILRVHDPLETKEAVMTAKRIYDTL
ncbi:MAG: dihydropteroate synthase [Fibrobacteres bacterium]|nr:dihydropteroate synthase [Fibrobacterota bacterium]